MLALTGAADAVDLCVTLDHQLYVQTRAHEPFAKVDAKLLVGAAGVRQKTAAARGFAPPAPCDAPPLGGKRSARKTLRFFEMYGVWLATTGSDDAAHVV